MSKGEFNAWTEQATKTLDATIVGLEGAQDAERKAPLIEELRTTLNRQ